MANGYTQKESFDYEEFFLPVAMIKSIRILLSIAAQMDYEVCQMDIKTTFLNGSLDETIYMVQSKGSLQRTRKIKCASCKSPFTDLSRHQGHGTSNLTSRSNHLDLFKVQMNLVCTRSAAVRWWCSWYFMLMISSLSEMV